MSRNFLFYNYDNTTNQTVFEKGFLQDVHLENKKLPDGKYHRAARFYLFFIDLNRFQNTSTDHKFC